MSGGGKGGSQTTEVKIPEWLEKEAQRNIDIARDVSQVGYVPYYGPDVAALSPMQNAAMAGTNAAAGAFGLQQAQGGMPAPQTFAGGVQGYSSGGLYNQSLEALKAQAPAQYDYMQGMFMDPVTGNAARSPFGAPAAPAMAPVQPVGQPFDDGGGILSGAEGSVYGGNGGGAFNTKQGPNMNGSAGYGVGGFTSFGDMFDGGGPGKSGGGFSGGPFGGLF